jgi:hypothetical protein
MKLEILQVPDCPNAAVLAARLAELAGTCPGLTVTHKIVTTAYDARRLGMTGSPTLLADGTDPFASPGHSPSISCRLYRDEQGRPAPAPSLGQLRTALRLRLGGSGRPGRRTRSPLGRQVRPSSHRRRFREFDRQAAPPGARLLAVTEADEKQTLHRNLQNMREVLL